MRTRGKTADFGCASFRTIPGRRYQTPVNTMNLPGWQRLFRRQKDDPPSPFESVVRQIRALRERCDPRTRFHAHAAWQRARRVAAARKRVVYLPPDYERQCWPEATPPRLQARWLVFAVATAAVLLMVTGVVFSSGLPWLRGSAHRECVATLRALEGSMTLWAIRNGKTTNDTPTDADLFGPTRYMPVKPTCPAGGKYIIGKIGDPPRCTIPEHRIER